jgi:hypothetical protein
MKKVLIQAFFVTDEKNKCVIEYCPLFELDSDFSAKTLELKLPQRQSFI